MMFLQKKWQFSAFAFLAQQWHVRSLSHFNTKIPRHVPPNPTLRISLRLHENSGSYSSFKSGELAGTPCTWH